jgi:Zn-dependent protease with chaperone function
MDFFEAQARAKKRTSRLVVLFVVAVIGTIIAMYFAALIIIGQTRGHRSYRANRYYDRDAYVQNQEPLPLWQPSLFGGVALATLAIVGLGSMYKWSEFSSGGKAVAASVGGRKIDPHSTDLSERRLLNVVEEMAIAAGLPVPQVYILEDEPAINAFAAGLTTSDAVVAVSRGAVDQLTRDELQGVIGHEFSHILNGDMRLNLKIAATIFGILVLGIVGRGIVWSLRGTRVRNSKNGGGAVAAILAIGIALVVIGYVGYFFGRLIQAAVSRQREFLADASSVQFTRNPSGIAGALKKIGGYGLGSTMQSNQSAAIGHFFFAQAFRTGITGLWATHPPLEERIRAIEPTFDGKFIAPTEDLRNEEAPFAGTRLVSPNRAGGSRPAGGTGLPSIADGARKSPSTSRLATSTALTAISTIGALTPEQITNAQALLDATPPRLRTAAQSPLESRVLLFGLLLDDDEGIRSRQRAAVASRAGNDALRILDELDPALRQVRDEQRLALVQIALPALRDTPPTVLQPFLDTLDELVRADGRVTPFEFALQKLLTRTLAVGRSPGAAVVQIYSFNAVIDEIAAVLSVLARASTSDAAQAPQAFAAGAAQIKLIESKLAYRDESAATLTTLDTALDKLATASLPIKQRTLVAAAHVVQADGQVLVCEYELLRAIAAALDVPMPPLAAATTVGVS